MYEEYNYNHQNTMPEVDLETRKRIEKKASRKASRKKWGSCIALALVFGLIAGCTFQGVNILGKKISSRLDNNKEVVYEKSEAENTEETSDSEEKKTDSRKAAVADSLVTTTYDVSAVAKQVMPSVVSITNKSIQEVRMMFGYGVQQYEATSCGSGIIMGENDDELLIVTNNHVVDGAEELTVGFVNDDVIEAKVKGTDAENDLAVIAVKKSDISDETYGAISIAQAGDSDSLNIGEPVVAIGNAMGYGQSVTTGIVSALDREVKIDNFSGTLIQTDAAINPGNSGGALLNLKGEVIGINSAKLSSNAIEGMGYAIPISSAEPILEELMNRETRDKVEAKNQGYLGISSTIELTKEYSDAMGIPTGVYVTEVSEDSPASKAGLMKGDVIKKFDGTSVSTITDLKELLQYYSVGESVDMIILRSDNGEYKEKTLSITLGSREGTPLEQDSEVKSDNQEDSSKAPDDESSTDNVDNNKTQDSSSDKSSNKQYEKSWNFDLGPNGILDIFGW